MKINKDSLKAKANNISKELNISQNVVYNRFFMMRFEIISTNVDDGIWFEIINIGNIRNEDQYGGFQITILGHLDNVKCQFGIDIATGNPIIPSEKTTNTNV